jgi:hypothetical protein
MKRYRWVITAALLACAWLPLSLPPAQAQIGGMTCIECHGDPLNGGFHGGFRSLGGLSDAEMEIVCLSCHDGSYTNPQGILAPEAAVHQNKNPGAGRDEYGEFKASCLDCHTNHSSPFTSLLAGDGTTSIVTISPTPDPDVDEAHDIEPTTVSFLLDEGSVILSAAHNRRRSEEYQDPARRRDRHRSPPDSLRPQLRVRGQPTAARHRGRRTEFDRRIGPDP